ncbi:restriction endonuclease subunit S [Corynebacterium hindlerae]|uniref:Restriction endonuclease subunit S n=1 Tax=Corynebacterium hindlerae TaxID=699041 RepID=A0A7G5FFY5_9CORY|nr:restriction endonuclease subunit S [Corynebacterium hindlerae]QMV85526.1 restriction endonuclease subunit S [Corynebacterium hindlerae]
MGTVQNKWLRKVNPDWKIVPSYLLFSDRQQQCLPGDEHLTPSQKYGVVRQSDFMETTGNRVVLNLSGANKMKHVEPGDFVIHLRSFQGGIEYSTLRGKVSNAYTVLSPSEDVHHDFFRWFMKSDLLISGLETLTDQLRDGQTINFARFSRLSFPLPPLDTQRAIADYLDRETGEIDAMLDKLNGLGRLLEERRKNEITQSFLSENTAELWHFCEVNPVTPEFRSLTDGTQVTFMPLETIWSDKRADFSRTIEWSKKVGSYTEFRSGDVLIPKITPTFEAGRSTVADIPLPIGLATTEVHIVRTRPERALSQWLSYAFQTSMFLKEGESVLQGVGNLRRISPQWLQSFKVPALSLDEQERISQHLDETTARIDAMLAKTQQLKDLLTERRSALITAAVTGQIKVY